MINHLVFRWCCNFESRDSEPAMKVALYWWCNYLGVLAGGLCVGAGSAWLGMSLVAMGTYFIFKNYGLIQ